MVKRYGINNFGKLAVQNSGQYYHYEDYDALAAELADWKRMRNEEMKLLADEKHKSEALAAELANEQKDRANADKVGLQYLSRIRELETALRYSAMWLPALDSIAHEVSEELLALFMTAKDGSTAETACECMPLDARGTPGDLEIYCPKCGKVFRKSETSVAQAPIPRPDPCAHPIDARGGVDRDYCLLCGATVANRGVAK